MNPSRNEIIKAVMTFEKRENKLVKNVFRQFVTNRCPKTNCSTDTISFQAGKGFQNPYAHLRSYYGHRKPLAEQGRIILGLHNDVYVGLAS